MNIKSTLFCFLFLLPGLNVLSQGWYHYYGGAAAENGNDIIQTSDGGFMVVGYTQSFGGSPSDMYIVKTDSLGRMVWQATAGGLFSESAVAVTENSNGDFFVVGDGTTSVSNIKDIVVAKFNAQGDLLWMQTYGGTGSDISSGIVSVGTDVVISGTTNSFGQGQNDIYLFKIDSSGTQLWSKTIGSLVNESSLGLAKVHDGGFLVCGKYSTPSFFTAYAARTDANGDSIWTKILNIGSDQIVEYRSCTELVGDSSFVMVGEGGSFYGTYYASRYDLNGDLMNHFTQSGYLRYALEVAPTTDGGFVVQGYPFMKFDYKAAVQWETNLIDGRDVLQATDGSYVTSGSEISAHTPLDYDVVITKTNPSGIPLNQSGGIEVIANPATSTNCPGTLVTLSVPDGFDHYQWFQYLSNWVTNPIPNSDNDTLVVDTTGSYYCLMTYGTETFISSLRGVGYFTLFSTQLNYTDSVSFCAADSSITLTGNVVSNTIKQWLLNGNPIPGATALSHVPVQSGNYTLATYYSNCSTQYTNTVYVNVNSVPEIIISPLSGSIDYYIDNGAACDSLLLTVTHHSGQNYQWFENGNAISGSLNTNYATDLGNYYAVVSNSCGSDTSLPVMITADTVATFGITITGPISGCGPESTYLLVPPISGHTYKWYRNGTLVSSSAGVSPNATGNYYCVINRTCSYGTMNIQTDSIYFNYQRRNKPTTNFQGTVPIICGADTLRLFINPVTGATYQWFVDSVAIPGANMDEYYASTTGYFYCVYTIAGCDPVPSHRIFIRNGLPISYISTPITQICSSQNLELSLVIDDNTSNGNTVIQWYRNGVPVANGNNDNLYTNQPAVYYCTVTNPCGVFLTNSITLTTPIDSVDITTSVGGVHFCKGDTIMLTGTLIPGYTYQWMGSSVIPGPNPNECYAAQPGAYQLQVNNGVCNMNNLIFVYHTAPVIVNIMSSGPPVVCSGSSVLLRANTRPDFTYQWTRDNQLLPGATQQDYTAFTPGDYVVSINDSLGCEYISPPKTVYGNSFGNFSIYTSSGNNVVCNGDSLTLYAGYSGTSYQWLYNTQPIPGATGYSINVADAGLYSVEVTDNSGCTGRVSLGVAVENITSYTATITPDLCNDSIGGISIYAYNTIVDVIWSTGATGNPITNIPAGNYTATITSSYGCTMTQVFQVPNTDTVPVTITGNTVKCADQIIGLGVYGSGFVSFLWSTGDTTNYMFPDTSGVYTVTVTNTYGCTGSDTVAVTFLPLPVINIIPDGPTAFCLGDSLKLSTDTGLTGHKWFRFGVQIPNALDSFIYVKSRGVYTCRATDSNNCSDTSAGILITIPCIPPRDPEEKFPTNQGTFTAMIQPNPSSGIFNLEIYSQNSKTLKISVTDLLGKEVAISLEDMNNGIINLADFQDGMYILKITDGSEQKLFKLIKSD